ncbi:MAG: hypothetical protein ACE5HY_00490 [Candidatus Hydrothermarchaeales archaeon]
MRKKLSERLKKSLIEGIRSILNIFEGVVVETLFALILLVTIYAISYVLMLVV